MKKILFFTLLAAFFAVIGTNTNSCAPTAPTETDTTKLKSAPSSLALTRADSSQSSSPYLTCGCPFTYTVIGYGGDTSVIHFNVSDSSQSISAHNVTTTIYPSKLPAGPNTVTAWVALLTWHEKTSTYAGIPLYDTIHVTATY
jgi:hypothetical protein